MAPPERNGYDVLLGRASISALLIPIALQVATPSPAQSFDWRQADQMIEIKWNGSPWLIQRDQLEIAGQDCGIYCRNADPAAVAMYTESRTCVGKCTFNGPRITAIDYKRHLIFFHVSTDYHRAGTHVIYEADPSTRTIRRIARAHGSNVTGGSVSPNGELLQYTLYNPPVDCTGNIRNVIVRLRDGASAVIETPTSANRNLQVYMQGLVWVSDNQGKVEQLSRTMAACAANDQRMQKTTDIVDVARLKFSLQPVGLPND